MTSPYQTSRISQAALAVLVVLQLTMLGALFTLTNPHPPLAVTPFALGPFLGAALSLAVAALILGGPINRTGAAVSIIAAVFALVSYGPHKWFDQAIGQIWPAVLLGQLAAGIVIAQAIVWLFGESRRQN
ncbi:hypothetical protein AB833_24950 [Chromatiales bacterium (ex Bugula neritina AB1)]|nr:hypothetical protein AB833_24950 [Chromatiales bacterium (ex Bugula neritina AB1)]